MGLELLAVLGVLMLGAGVMILVANLRKESSTPGMPPTLARSPATTTVILAGSR